MPYSMGFQDVAWFLVIGGLAGWLASIVVEGQGLGILGDIAVGIAGALLGGFFAYQFDIAVYGLLQVLGMSTLGSVVLLVVFRALSKPRLAAQQPKEME